MMPSRARKRIGLLLMITGALVGAWMVYRGYRFIFVDAMASTIGDQSGWTSFLYLAIVILCCAALVPVGFRAAWRPPPQKYATGQLVVAAGTTLGVVLLSFGGWYAIAGLIPLGVGGVMLVTSFGDPEARYPKPRSPAP